MTPKKIKVLQIDDSAVVRQELSRILSSAPDVEIIGSVIDPLFAMERMKQTWPDVILLDLEMPRMDGLTFLKKIMAERPTPVVICSTLTEKGSDTTMQALAAGAVDIVCKPTIGVKGFLAESAQHLIQIVRAAARANVKNIKPAPVRPPIVEPRRTADAMLSAGTSLSFTDTTDKVIAIGSSTGGTTALEEILAKLPRVVPGIVVVQHMPENFTRSFAQRLNSLCQIEVKEAETNDRVVPGRALIAPGGKHILLRRNGAQYGVEVRDGPLVSRHRPSVDVLFRSTAKVAGTNALGIILTGMGDDGARGLKEMLDAGARTIAQDEASCIVYGMPKEAVAHGGVQEVLPLSEVPAAMVNRLREPNVRRSRSA